MLSAVAPALAATSGPSTPHAATAPATPAAGPAYRHACGVPTPSHYTCDALIRTDVLSRATMRPGDTNLGYAPSDLWSAYRITAAAHHKGHGQVVAIVDAHDDPTAAADLKVYRKQFGLPPCTFANGCFRKINQNGSAAKS
ncbi:MAG: peptidase S8, partial [Actinomycetota bacterium]